tara:strand:- start:181 stop:486 length:306 start_codon:yes stop_codon:yes gene_type:complete
MAKRKTPKTETVIDLTPKAEKITDEQLQKVQEVINNLNRTQMEVGQIESKKHELLHTVAGLRGVLSELQTEFQKEYGSIDINIQNGTINYPSENGETDKKD